MHTIEKPNIEQINNIIITPSIELVEVEMTTEESQEESEKANQKKLESMEEIKIIQEKMIEKAKSLDKSI